MLGTAGHVSELRRTRVGPFALHHARTLEQLDADPTLSLPLDDAVAAQDVRHGRPLPHSGLPGVHGVFAPDGRVLALMAEGRDVTPLVNRMLPRHDEFLLPLEQITQPTMLLWTRDNPIHDLECAQAAVGRIPDAQLYVMEADGAHWPQYEAPEEFNRVTREFFA